MTQRGDSAPAASPCSTSEETKASLRLPSRRSWRRPNPPCAQDRTDGRCELVRGPRLRDTGRVVSGVRCMGLVSCFVFLVLVVSVVLLFVLWCVCLCVLVFGVLLGCL